MKKIILLSLIFIIISNLSFAQKSINKKIISNNLLNYDMFGKVITKDLGGSMFAKITIKISPNKYFQYYRDYDYNSNSYCKMKILSPKDFKFSIALNGCKTPTKYFKNNKPITSEAFWDSLTPGSNLGVKFEKGFLKTEVDNYTLIDQSDGLLIAVRIDILSK